MSATDGLIVKEHSDVPSAQIAYSVDRVGYTNPAEYDRGTPSERAAQARVPATRTPSQRRDFDSVWKG
jgi:hypothetical protein